MIPTINIADLEWVSEQPMLASACLFGTTIENVYARWVWPDGHDYYGILIISGKDELFWPDYEAKGKSEFTKMWSWVSGPLNDLLEIQSELAMDYEEEDDINFGGYPNTLFHYSIMKFFMHPDWNPR